MNNEYVYFFISKDAEGVRSSAGCFESLISDGMMDAAIAGIRYADLDAYYARVEDVVDWREAEILRGWFVVKMMDGISREEMAEAIKYG